MHYTGKRQAKTFIAHPKGINTITGLNVMGSKHRTNHNQIIPASHNPQLAVIFLT